MMNTTLIEIIKDIGHPIFYDIDYNLPKYVDRLEFLLWGKTEKYIGPLSDGFEEYEWISISLLLSDWLIEIFTDARVHEFSIINQIRDNPQEIASFTIELLSKLIYHDIIKTNKKAEVLLFLQNELVINTVTSHADEILLIIENIISKTCGFCCSNKTQKIQDISERDGLYAYKANNALNKK